MTEKLKTALKKIAQIGLPLALGIIILYFLYNGTNFNSLWSDIQHANWGILTLSLIFGLSGNVIRGLRWELLIKPLGYTPKKSNLIYAVLGNYAINFALPRAGEIWRCGVISKDEKIPFQKLIGTLIIDRAFDTLMVIFILFIAFLSNVAVFYRNQDLFNLPSFLISPVFYAGCFAFVILIAVIIAFFKDNFIVKKIRAFLASMWNDMKIVWRMKEKKLFIAYTFGIWFSYFLYFYVTFFAFGFTANLGIAAALFIFTLNSISMGIPSNGGLGPWQAATVLGLCTFMVDNNQARAFATAVFAFQSIWVVLCGLFGIAALSLKNRKI
ncbi:MAG: flippase-like domain-containing protein [Dysgonamonadaceae bacterium]|jgi:uncharacterized protein (TIRG00374 family)|nr:flippase-like domain-containing protein [Dysgonamonadaceae bacterium]